MSAGTDLIHVANTIAVERKRQGRTQEDVGEAIGRSQSTVAKYEGVHSMPEALETLFRLANELGLSVRLVPSAEASS